MQTYLAAKYTELEIGLARLGRAIDQIEQDTHHPSLASYLRDEERRLRDIHHRLSLIVRSGLKPLVRRGEIYLTEFQARYIILQDKYLSALTHEGKEEGEISRLIWKAIGRLSIGHIQDVVAFRGHPWAIFTGLPQTPVFYVPLYQKQTLVDLAGLYHEIGHSVYQQDRSLGIALKALVENHFQELARSTPPLPPDKQAQRLIELLRCVNYWTAGHGRRLEELFCDVFATLVTGPAHVYSWMDFTITASLRKGPYTIDLCDMHPPDAFRGEACFRALDTACQGALVIWMHQLWEDFLSGKEKVVEPVPYDLLCPEQLLSALVAEIRQQVVRLGFQVYDRPCLEPADALKFTNVLELEELLNAATINLIYNPAQYPQWEERSISLLFEAL